VTDVASGERRVGRFGWKAQHATLLSFGADAYRNEINITNDVFPEELALGIASEQMRVCDPIPDPEDVKDPRTRRRGIDNFASFMKFSPAQPRADRRPARAGSRCSRPSGARPVTPVLRTGPSSNPLFNRRPVPLYSTCCC
jgi:hypothetical protein